MRKYKKRNSEIEAFQFFVDPVPGWFMDTIGKKKSIITSINDIWEKTDSFEKMPSHLALAKIETDDGEKLALNGWFICKDESGNIFPMDPVSFERVYKSIESKVSFENEDVFVDDLTSKFYKYLNGISESVSKVKHSELSNSSIFIHQKSIIFIPLPAMFFKINHLAPDGILLSPDGGLIPNIHVIEYSLPVDRDEWYFESYDYFFESVHNKINEIRTEKANGQKCICFINLLEVSRVKGKLSCKLRMDIKTESSLFSTESSLFSTSEE